MRQDDLLPLYEQVRRRIVSDIAAGIYPPGGFLPPEAELVTRLGVSRITLRRAVGELCREGLLIRQQGRGTLVAPRKIANRLSLSGFSETMAGLGRQAGHRVLAMDSSPDPAELPGATRPISFLRLLEVDGATLTLERLFFDAERFAGAVAKVGAGGSFFGALRDLYAITPAGSERQIDVGFPEVAEADWLGIAATQQVYRIEKTVFGAGDQVLSRSLLVTPCHLVVLTMRN